MENDMLMKRKELGGGSLRVDNVQALASKGLKKNIPPRYIRPELDFDDVSVEESLRIPVIDMGKLDTADEAMKFHQACKDWGFFQLINHGMLETVEKMKVVAQEFFKLPLEEKMAYAQQPNDVEGYGQGNVVSEDQKLDWNDMLAVFTQPLPVRNLRFWPTSPTAFRSTLDAYSSELLRIEIKLLIVMAKNLGVNKDEFLDLIESGLQAIRINYYPPCELADKVIGFTPHSDASVLTMVVQINDVPGLQIKKDNKWIPVNPLPGAFIVNIGDIIEILSNGEYSSIEHRAVVNREKERMSIAAFHNLNMEAMVGPLLKKNQVAKYKNIGHEEFLRLFLSRGIDGKSLLDHMKI